MEEAISPWLVVHVLAIAVAYGSVLIVDFMGLLWLLGKIDRERMIKLTNWDQPVIWTALITILASGVLLEPDLTKTLMKVKMLLVLAMLANGFNLEALRKKTLTFTDQRFWDLPRSFQIWSAGSIMLSQVLWLSIILLGVFISRT